MSLNLDRTVKIWLTVLQSHPPHCTQTQSVLFIFMDFIATLLLLALYSVKINLIYPIIELWSHPHWKQYIMQV
jgi:hypothetical protein